MGQPRDNDPRASYALLDTQEYTCRFRRVPYAYEIDLWATSYIFAAGHRIRLEVSSSNFDRYDRNLNTGRFAFDDEVAVAEQTVHHSADHPSYVTLPVMAAR